MKILIADDHPLIREGITNILFNIYPDLSLLETSSYIETIAIIKNHHDINMVILDLYMPDFCANNSVIEIRSLIPCIPLIVISSSENTADIKLAIDSGANGYITKSTANNELSTALSTVMQGKLYISNKIAVQNNNDHTREPASKNKNASDKLTNRQQEVLEYMSHGETNKEIARRLDISEKTVKTHISLIFQTLNVTNRTQAVITAKNHGIINREVNII